MMADIREPIANVPSPVDITIYQGSDQDISFYPFYDKATATANPPAGWATDYSYVLYIWDKNDTTTNIKTINGTNDAVTGLTSFPFSRADRMDLTWTAPKQYEITEIVGGEVVEVPAAGSFTLMLRSGVST